MPLGPFSPALLGVSGMSEKFTLLEISKEGHDVTCNSHPEKAIPASFLSLCLLVFSFGRHGVWGVCLAVPFTPCGLSVTAV